MGEEIVGMASDPPLDAPRTVKEPLKAECSVNGKLLYRWDTATGILEFRAPQEAIEKMSTWTPTESFEFDDPESGDTLRFKNVREVRRIIDEPAPAVHPTKRKKGLLRQLIGWGSR